MPDTAKVPAEDGLRVTITIAEKAPSSSTKSASEKMTDTVDPNTFEITSGNKILTITIAE